MRVGGDSIEPCVFDQSHHRGRVFLVDAELQQLFLGSSQILRAANASDCGEPRLEFFDGDATDDGGALIGERLDGPFDVRFPMKRESRLGALEQRCLVFAIGIRNPELVEGVDLESILEVGGVLGTRSIRREVLVSEIPLRSNGSSL